MKIHLHKNATTTPAQRSFIQNNPDLSVAVLAEKMGVSRTTVRRWRRRSDVYDRPHTPKQVNRALTPEEDVKIALCRLATRAGLDDLQKIVAAFLDIRCSRAGLNRCLKRYHISRLPGLNHEVPYDLKDYSGTYLYYSCFYLPAFSEELPYICVHTLLDCSFRIFKAEFRRSGHEFLDRHIQEFPLKVLGILYQEPLVLTDSRETGTAAETSLMVESQCRAHKIISHRLNLHSANTLRQLKATCADLEARSMPPAWDVPWSSAAEFSGSINEYNSRFSMGALKKQTPRQALKNHYTHFPGSFRQKPEAWA